MGHGRRVAGLGARIAGAVAKQQHGEFSFCGSSSSSSKHVYVASSRMMNLVNVSSQKSSSSLVDGGNVLSHGANPGLPLPLLQVRRMSCCARLDLPPPRELIVEYEEKPENDEFFIQFANDIEEVKPELRVLENPDDMQPRSGSFEVTSGQHVLFSKLQAKRLPKVEEILLALEQLPTEALSCELDAKEEAAATA